MGKSEPGEKKAACVERERFQFLPIAANPPPLKPTKNQNLARVWPEK
jgi:SET domain-containing protein